jgi:hypothetical protein
VTRPAITIPPALQPLAKRRRWMIWKWERVKGRDGKLKLTKPPYRADAPNRHAKSTDPSTWCDLATAMRVYVQDQCDGVDVALMGSAVGALDLDDCRDKQTGDLHPWALDKIKRSGSYAEVTPSGEGARIIGLAKGAKIHRELNVPNANGASVELYRRAERFITVTGIQIGDAAKMVKIDALLDQTLAELDKNPPKPRKHDLAKLIKDGCGQDFDGDRSRAVWYVINQLLRQGRATATLSRSCSIAATASQPTSTISRALTNTRASKLRRRRPSLSSGLPNSSKTAKACPTATSPMS